MEVSDQNKTIDIINKFFSAGCDGIFMINNKVACEELLLLYRNVRKLFPNKWLGLSLNDVLAHEIYEIFPLDADAYWIKDIHITDNQIEELELNNILELKTSKQWQGKIIGQLRISTYDDEKNFNLAMRIARSFVDVVVIKSINSLSKTKFFLNSIRSSVDPRNLGMSFSSLDCTKIKHYLPHIRYLLFFDGLNGYNYFDEEKFMLLVHTIRKFENDYTPQE